MAAAAARQSVSRAVVSFELGLTLCVVCFLASVSTATSSSTLHSPSIVLNELPVTSSQTLSSLIESCVYSSTATLVCCLTLSEQLLSVLIGRRGETPVMSVTVSEWRFDEEERPRAGEDLTHSYTHGIYVTVIPVLHTHTTTTLVV